MQETGVHGKSHRPTPSHFIIKAAGMKVIKPPSIVYITVVLYLTEKYKKNLKATLKVKTWIISGLVKFSYCDCLMYVREVKYTWTLPNYNYSVELHALSYAVVLNGYEIL